MIFFKLLKKSGRDFIKFSHFVYKKWEKKKKIKKVKRKIFTTSTLQEFFSYYPTIPRLKNSLNLDFSKFNLVVFQKKIELDLIECF